MDKTFYKVLLAPKYQDYATYSLSKDSGLKEIFRLRYQSKSFLPPNKN